MKKEDVFFQFIAKSELTQDTAKIELGRLKIIPDCTLLLLKATSFESNKVKLHGFKF